MSSPDFRLLFEASPASYLILAPDLTIIAVNEAYLRATLTTRDELVGKALFDAFPDNPHDPTATGVRNLQSSLDRVLRERRPDTMAIQKYDIPRPQAEGGGFEERYWSPVNTPVLGADGEVLYIIHHVEDVTSMVQLERHRNAQDETIRALAIEGEERLSHILDAAPDAIIVVDASGRVRFANTRTEQLFGYSKAELLGSNLEALIPEALRSAHSLHLRHYFTKPTIRTARSMGPTLELRALRKDGTEMSVEISLSPLPIDGEICASAAIRDVSERKRIEAAARVLAARLASAVESIDDAFAIFDENDRLFLCNSSYRRLVPSTMNGTLVGRHYREIFDEWLHDLDLASEDERSALRRARHSAHRAVRSELDVRTRDGRSLRVIDRRTPEGGVVETIWDLTEDARLAAELREARSTAEAASAAKSEFLSSMSHELRTPLNSILGFSQLLLQDKRHPLVERHRQRLDHILKGGQHLLKLIDDILDLARIEAGRTSVSIEPVDLATALLEVETTLAPMAHRAGLRLEHCQLTAPLPPISVDRTRFAQILMNFGSNAVKYNRAGGTVRFEVSRPDSEHVRVAVHDTGFGIPFDKQALLFQPFQRAGQETGAIEGTGIGLVITKRLAELMRGSVGFRSVQGEGSTFWVDLPVATLHSSAMSAGRDERSPRLRLDDDTKARILYIEDNAANASFMRDFLSDYREIKLVVARSAEEGVEIACEMHPDVIIADINLPGMSGLDALKALRRRSETARVPVIALSAAASARDRKVGLDAGFQRYLTKPLDVDELESALAELIPPLD